MATYVEFYLDQGTTFNNVINLADDLTNAPINVASYNVTSQMKRSYYSANVTANIDCIITDQANGEIILYMTAANTAKIKAGRYVFDVKITEPNELITTRIIEGIITVTPQVTK